MRAAFLLLLAGLMPAMLARADQPFWICVDAQFNKTVQDTPCAYAPEAPPSGSAAAVVPERAQGSVPAVRTPPSASRSKSKSAEFDPGDWWQHQWKRAQKLIEDRGGFGALLRNPWVYAAAGLIVLLLTLRWASRELLPRWRERRREREASAQPDAYRHAHGQDPRSKKKQPAAASPPDLAPERPTRWTHEVLRSLSAPQFAQLCSRLWQLRGLQVEPDGREGDALLLRRAVGTRDLHGVVLIRGAGTEPLGSRAVRELLGLMSHHGCDYGVLMTSGEFNTEARNFVRGKSMELKGWMTLMTELDALADAPRTALLAEIFGGERPPSALTGAMLAP